MPNQTVAVIGASTDRSKFGNKAVRAHIAQGWTVYPVNPNGGTIEDISAYTSINNVPKPLTRIAMYVPPAVGLKLIPDIAAANPEEFFVNPGAESDELIAAAKEADLDPIQACAIVDIGTTPAAFSD